MRTLFNWVKKHTTQRPQSPCNSKLPLSAKLPPPPLLEETHSNMQERITAINKANDEAAAAQEARYLDRPQLSAADEFSQNVLHKLMFPHL
jgi:hypothetical protein